MNNLKLDPLPGVRIVACPDADDNAGSMHYELNVVDEASSPAGVVLGYVCTSYDHAELVKRWNAYPELVAKLKAFIECARWEEANQDSPNSALMNYAQHADDARTLLQTLKA